MGKSGANAGDAVSSSAWADYRAGEQGATLANPSATSTYASSMSPDAITSANIAQPAAGTGGTDWRAALTQVLAGMGQMDSPGGGIGGSGGQAPGRVSYEQQMPQMGKLPFALTPPQLEIARKAGAVLAALSAGPASGQGGGRGA